MSDIGTEELQIAIYNQLKAQGLNVYSTVLPKEYSFPMVKMEEEYLTDQSTKNKIHWEIYHVLHIFSLSKSKEEINEYNQKVIQALREPFELMNGFYVSKSRLDYLQTLREEDAFHGVLRFTFTISKG
ncbi:tail completion protein gp17 [Priestia filamentosa]|uniref:tail completion protein gp17 n=1 Tax=Priestia filamentosa TaxID=1402861 RepID=UPI000A0831F7|nr:DUF3168 domain-containing protein [Priestia filamentosa]OXS69839.1 hypothetical protein B1B01_12875 [Priestia filamentosa]SMF36737.1 Protein of unknown function [Priestia filamentosa]